MNRKDFLKSASFLSIGAFLFPSLFTSCGKTDALDDDLDSNFSGKVIIIGAGAAGLSAGYALHRYGIDFEIVEASPVYGGRVKRADNFADFPIDLGGEWIHTDPNILATLADDNNNISNIETIRYSPKTMHLWKDGKLRKRGFYLNFYNEYKFKKTTWYGFFEQHIVPDIKDKITYNSPINSIEYSGDKVVVTTVNGQVREADKVILTVPLTILKNDFITFSPELPSDKKTALSQVDMPDGIKVFIEFSEKFYADIMGFGSLQEFLGSTNGDRIYYDAAFRKEADKHVLGLFSVGEVSSQYATIDSDDDLITKILAELDEVYDGKASQTYIKHIVQNWSKEPFIQGSYSNYDSYDMQETLSAPIDNKIYFAGEAYHPQASSTVHGAALSAYDVVQLILSQG